MTKYLTGYHSDRPLLDPAAYIHLCKALHSPRKPSTLERLASFIRRKVTTTLNK